MSEKKWKLDSRVPHHYRGGRKWQDSKFPHRGMNEYEGERLPMGKHCLSKHNIQSHNKKRYGWAWLHQKYINGLLKKYQNRPFDEMLSEFYAKTKSLRQSQRQFIRETSCYFDSEVETEHNQFSYRQGGKRKYYIDDNGILRLTEKENTTTSRQKLTRKQRAHNHQVPVPTFKATDFAMLKQKYDTSDLYVGDYYAIVNDEVRKVPIYTAPYRSDSLDVPGRIKVEGVHFSEKFNNVFRKFTYTVLDESKMRMRDYLEKLKQENKPEDAERIRRMERQLNALHDYRLLRGSMSLYFYTKL